MKPLATICAPILASLLLLATFPSVSHAQSSEIEDLEKANDISNILLAAGVGLAVVAIVYTVATRDKKKEDQDRERGEVSDSTAAQVASLDHRSVIGAQAPHWQERLQTKEKEMPVRLFVAPGNHYARSTDAKLLGFPVTAKSVVVGVAVKF